MIFINYDICLVAAALKQATNNYNEWRNYVNIRRI